MKNFILYAIIVIVALGALFIWRSSRAEIELSEDIAQNQMRIISVSPNITEILFALGLGDSVVGVTDFCNYPEQARSKQSIGTIMDPDLETILSLNPTNVFVTNTSFHINLGKRLSDMGLTVHILDVDRMDGVSRSILDIADIAGCAEKGRELNAEIQTGLDVVKLTADKFTKRPKVLVVVQSEPIIAVGRGTYIDEILSLAGGENAIIDTTHLYPMINAEVLIELNPDIIIESRVGAVTGRDEVALSHYKWEVAAVVNKDVFVIEADKLSRPGPRVVAAAGEMQQIISMVQEDKP